MISSSGSAEASCILGIEALTADPHSSLTPNWAGHLTTLEPGRQDIVIKTNVKQYLFCYNTLLVILVQERRKRG